MPNGLRTFACGVLASCLAFGQATRVGAEARVPQSTDLGRYYSTMEASLRGKGYLRQDMAAGASVSAEQLAQHFVTAALRQEYRGGTLSRSGAEKPLIRWEEPVRMAVHFGASVPRDQRASDQREIEGFVRRLSRITGQPIGMTRVSANFHVLVVSDDERRGLRGFLKANVAGISDQAIRAILSMQREHYCMVVAVPHADKARGYRSAVAIVRAEHGDLMRRSCIQEELAQGMGLPNDCRDARPSIFNDDGEFALLTRHDEKLLAMLYSRELRSGMTAREALPVIMRLAARAAGS